MTWSWNREIASWERYVASEPAHEPGAAPAGPAGVSILRSGAAVFSLCTQTGRVTYGCMPAEPEPDELRLFELVQGHPLDPAKFRPNGGTPFEDEAAPAQERAAVVRYVHLVDTVRNVRFHDDVVAEFFSWVEFALAIDELQELDEANLLLAPEDELSWALTNADRSADRVLDTFGDADGAAGSISAAAARAIGDRLEDDGLGAAFGRLTRRSGRGSRAAAFLNGLRRELDGFKSAAVLEAAPPSVDSFFEPSAPADATLHESIRWRTEGAAETASRAGWVARQLGDAGVPNMRLAAELIFAEAAVAWLALGGRLRAGWAWASADQEHGRLLLERAGLAGRESELAKAAADPDVPGPDQLLRPALWSLAVASLKNLQPHVVA